MAFQQASNNPIKHRYTDFGKDRIEVAKWLIQIRDAYNLNYAYTMMHDWLAEEGWISRADMYFPETYYMQRESPNFGKEIWVRWRMTKPPPGTKPGGLFTYAMDVNWKIIGLKKTEITWQGQKVKADRSEIEVECFAALIIDKEKTWENSIFKSFKDLFVKRTLRNQISMHKKEIHHEAYRMRDLIMNYLKQETFMETKEAGEFFVKRTLE